MAYTCTPTIYKNKLNLISKNYHCQENDKKYANYRNKLHHLLRKIKQIINKNCAERSNKIFRHNNRIINDGTLVSETSNDYFTNMGPNIAKQIPASQHDAHH